MSKRRRQDRVVAASPWSPREGQPIGCLGALPPDLAESPGHARPLAERRGGARLAAMCRLRYPRTQSRPVSIGRPQVQPSALPSPVVYQYSDPSSLYTVICYFVL
ncbi:hypothetical protein BS78_K065000 [Paspalum vaginatum]|uniref:Uncharacterized protein n=1 Tax=Paspalum vaginatum TaxID=158149 RepID=A0A9W8CFZ2_9POAL|nr:hypothetical protein BS78_K065000 [Paspalum vaginatum]